MKYVDPDGREIKFAPGSSKHFRNAFNQAVTYLKQRNALGPLADVINNPNYVVILKQESQGESSFVSKSNTLNWNPNLGLITTGGNVLSPSTILVHEADHAQDANNNPSQHNEAIKQTDAEYGTTEEKRVITGSETETAIKLGEIQTGEVSRKDHKGTSLPVKNAMSTESPYETTIKPLK